MNKVFFFSGLGADKRAFDALKLKFNERITYVDWPQPLKKETFRAYAHRIIDQYRITKNDHLVGLSFGGLMAVEIQQILDNEKVILLSSASTKKELHPFFKITAWLGLNRLIPKKQLNKPNPLLYKGFGIKNEDQKQLLDSIIKDTNVDFAHWAISQMSKWNVVNRDNRIIKIHGTSDQMIPNSNLPSDYTINGGGHFMVVDRSEEISTILNAIFVSE